MLGIEENKGWLRMMARMNKSDGEHHGAAAGPDTRENKRPEDSYRGSNVTPYRARAVEEPPSSAPLLAFSLDELITARDRFLSECFDIESGRRFVIDAQDADDRLGYLRGRIEEIHEEIARRDMEGDEPDRHSSQDDVQETDSALRATLAEPELRHEAETLKNLSADGRLFLERTAERISLLDDLARLAHEKGDLEQAAQFAVQAQTLDRELIEFLGDYEDEK